MPIPAPLTPIKRGSYSGSDNIMTTIVKVEFHPSSHKKTKEIHFIHMSPGFHNKAWDI
jgi:hypothetical protein